MEHIIYIYHSELSHDTIITKDYHGKAWKPEPEESDTYDLCGKYDLNIDVVMVYEDGNVFGDKSDVTDSMKKEGE